MDEYYLLPQIYTTEVPDTFADSKGNQPLKRMTTKQQSNATN